MKLELAPRSLLHAPPLFFMGRKPLHLPDQIFSVTRSRVQSGPAMINQLAERADIAGDHRHAGGKRLDTTIPNPSYQMDGTITTWARRSRSATRSLLTCPSNSTFFMH